MRNALLFAIITTASAADLPPCKVGMHVPIVSPLNYGATILEADEAKGTYKVKSDSDGMMDWVPARSLRYSCVGTQAQPIAGSFLVGTWELFVGPVSRREVRGDDVYRVTGTGAKAPPIVINADGTYSWKLDSKATVQGRWRTLADNEMRSGTKGPAILLTKGEGGANWQVSRRGTSPGDNRDQISIDRMDMGVSYMGTRSK